MMTPALTYTLACLVIALAVLAYTSRRYHR